MSEFKRILVPLDGSVLAEKALPYATALAHKFGSELVLMRVVDLPFQATEVDEVVEQWMKEAMQASYREARAYLDARMSELQQQNLYVHSLLREESPAEDILLAAHDEQIDLIVMSSHGKGGAAPWTSGSVADKVMQHSPCPVLLVRQHTK